MDRCALILLLIIPGIQGGDWRVTIENQCALRGTSVVLKCEYDYPFGNIVTSLRWSKVQKVSGNWRELPLSPGGHFAFIGDYRGDCRLKINNVQSADEGAYGFSFVATLGSRASTKPAYLSVRELTTVVQPSTVTEGGKVSLTCMTGCAEPLKVVWFKDGRSVLNPVFQAGIEDAGRYHCALHGQEEVRSAAVALTVHYAPKEVTLTVNPSGDIIKGGVVHFTCSCDANPPVTQSGYSLYRDGEFIGSGQKHVIADIQPSHSGRYRCLAWNNISWRGRFFISSTAITLDVQYGPMNISVSMEPPTVVEGAGVNLTCSSAANPAADNYTWYKMTASQTSQKMVQVGSGQVLSLASVEASHTGFYICKVRNSLGENNSTEVILTMAMREKGSPPLLVLIGIGISLIVILIIALLLFCLSKKKLRTTKDTNTVFDKLSGRGSDFEESSDTVYANVQASRKDAFNSHEEEVTYSTVTIKERNPSPPSHMNRSRSAKVNKDDSSVIYASVNKSS
ncbi:B-cell receptor CD22-like isoform 2-T2 [Menidia menidia]